MNGKREEGFLPRIHLLSSDGCVSNHQKCDRGMRMLREELTQIVLEKAAFYRIGSRQIKKQRNG